VNYCLVNTELCLYTSALWAP